MQKLRLRGREGRGRDLSKVVNENVVAARFEAGVPHSQSTSLLSHLAHELLQQELDKHQYQHRCRANGAPDGTGLPEITAC